MINWNEIFEYKDGELYCSEIRVNGKLHRKWFKTLEELNLKFPEAMLNVKFQWV